VILTFAIAGWLAGVVVLATDADRSLLVSTIDPAAVRSGIAAALAGLIWGPLVGWTRPRWYLAALIGLPVALVTLYLFFFVWPHSWQDGRLSAWKSALLFGKVYWRYLVPVAMLATVAANRWARMPVRGPQWASLVHDEEGHERPETGNEHRTDHDEQRPG